MYESKILYLDTQFLLQAQQDSFAYHYRWPLTVQTENRRRRPLIIKVCFRQTCGSHENKTETES